MFFLRVYHSRFTKLVVAAYLASGCIIPALPWWSLQHIWPQGVSFQHRQAGRYSIFFPPGVSLPLYQAGRCSIFGLKVHHSSFTMVVATAYLASGFIIPALPRWSLQHIRPPDVSLPLGGGVDPIPCVSTHRISDPRSGPAQLLPPHVKQRSYPHGVRPQIPDR